MSDALRTAAEAAFDALQRAEFELRGVTPTQDMAEAAEALRAALAGPDQDAADAARYRWLRSAPKRVSDGLIDVALWANECGTALRLEDLDAAIDSAMKENKYE